MINTSRPTSVIDNESKAGMFNGQTTLIAGTKTVLNTSVKAVDNIVVSRATAGGTPGILSIGTITPGVSFIINSSSALDTSVVNWQFNQ